MKRIIPIIVVALVLSGVVLTPRVQAAPVISNINVPFTCNTSVLINFRTNVPATAYIDYGPTAGYGSATIHDTVRFYLEHAIQLTGLTPNTTYNFRITTVGGGTTQSSNQLVTTASSGALCPTLPAEVDSRMPDMTGAVEKNVCPNVICSSGATRDYTTAQFQTALNDAGTASEKRIITVEAGATVTGSFTLPANADQNQIIVRSSRHAELPAGKRVVPTDATKMFRIMTNTMDAALYAAIASNHVRIIGGEITIDPAALSGGPSGPEQSGIVQFQANVAGSAANLPKFMGFDRCYIHGQPNANTRRGIFLSGEDLFVIDSYLDEFHSPTGDAQAILAAAVKRHRILNNTIIGSGENYMWGGTGIGVSGYVIEGLEYLRNHMYHPLAWKVSNEWREKNLFELKTSAKVLFFGNYLGGVTASQGGFWPDAQSMSINIKLEQNSGAGTCDLMEDLVFYRNFSRNVASGWQITGRTNAPGSCTNLATRVFVRDNVIEADSATWTPDPGAASPSWNATGWYLAGSTNLQVVHNTMINANSPQSASCNSVFGDGMMLLVGDPVTTKITGFVFKDNLNDWRGCGVAGGGCNGTNATCSLNGVFLGWIFTNNGVMRGAGVQANFPAGNIFATAWSPQLVSFNGGLSGNYTVASGSLWKNAASDGTDIGADIAGTTAATAFTPTGDWPVSPGGAIVCRWSTNPPCGNQ